MPPGRALRRRAGSGRSRRSGRRSPSPRLWRSRAERPAGSRRPCGRTRAGRGSQARPSPGRIRPRRSRRSQSRRRPTGLRPPHGRWSRTSLGPAAAGASGPAERAPARPPPRAPRSRAGRLDPVGSPAPGRVPRDPARTGTTAGRGPRSLPRPEAPLALLVLAQACLEGLAAEVGPELVAEDELRVRALPEQVVGDPLLAAGPDQQVGVVHLGRVEVLLKLLLPASLVGRGGIEDLGPAAVVEGDEQRDPIVPGGLGLGPVHSVREFVADAFTPADEAHPDALLVELRRLTVDALREHRHQAIDLLLRPGPVLGREGVDGELPDAELD